MVSGFLVDTSLLRVFSSIDRLDLLESWQPLIVTPEIRREHGQAPPQAEQALAASVRKGMIRVEKPDVSAMARLLLDTNPALSYVDAEAILHAEQNDYAVFVADKQFRLECGRRSIPVAGVGSILHAVNRQGGLTKAEVEAIASEMEAAGYYRFSDAERKGLGL